MLEKILTDIRIGGEKCLNTTYWFPFLSEERLSTIVVAATSAGLEVKVEEIPPFKGHGGYVCIKFYKSESAQKTDSPETN